VSEQSHASLPLYSLLGFTFVEQKPGHVVLEAEIRPEFRNRRGVVHGGIISALMDSALGGAVVAGIRPEEWCATLQLSVQYAAAARHGPLRAEGRMERRARQCAFARGTILDGDGTPVAHGQGSLYVFPRKPD
jgi:uncharacterized protein (TIGR00369 family)